MKHKRLYAVLIVVAIADLLTTAWAYSHGIGEGNPLLSPLVLEAMIVIKAIIVLAI